MVTYNSLLYSYYAQANYIYDWAWENRCHLYTQNILVCIMVCISCAVAMCHPKSVSLIEFLMDFCIYDDILDTLLITNKSY